MAKDPAFLFYPSDFYMGTITMTDEQVGKYIRLLILQFQKKRLTETDMLYICKSYDKDIYDKFTKEDDLFYNKRLEEETIKRQNYSKSRSDNRKKTYEKDMNNICSTHDKHMENININENINVTKENKIIIDSTFDIYWSAYPVKVAKKKTQDIYIKLEKKNALPDIDTHLKIINKWKQSENWKDAKFIPHPATWLNQERWNDEIPEIKKDIKKDPDNLGLMSKLMGGS